MILALSYQNLEKHVKKECMTGKSKGAINNVIFNMTIF